MKFFCYKNWFQMKKKISDLPIKLVKSKCWKCPTIKNIDYEN